MPFIDIKPRCPGMCVIHCQDGDVPERDLGDDIITRVGDKAPFLDALIDWRVVESYDAYLDAEVSQMYRDQPLARTITRITKLFEEAGEAIKKFSEATGENPRKGVTAATEDVLDEAGDVYLSAILLVQHFTKDPAKTAAVLRKAMAKLEMRNAAVRA